MMLMMMMMMSSSYSYSSSCCWAGIPYPTLPRWFAVSAGGDRDAADDLGTLTYQVKYSEYYEPYVIMAAVR